MCDCKDDNTVDSPSAKDFMASLNNRRIGGSFVCDLPHRMIPLSKVTFTDKVYMDDLLRERLRQSPDDLAYPRPPQKPLPITDPNHVDSPPDDLAQRLDDHQRTEAERKAAALNRAHTRRY
jgi:hypothetical protein